MLPGGVNSPVRAFKSVGGQPIIFESVKGSKCYDVDGNEYIDYVGSWGPAIVGHANDEVNAALKAQVDKGTSFGAPCELEVSSQCTVAACVHRSSALRSTECLTEYRGTCRERCYTEACIGCCLHALCALQCHTMPLQPAILCDSHKQFSAASKDLPGLQCVQLKRSG